MYIDKVIIQIYPVIEHRPIPVASKKAEDEAEKETAPEEEVAANGKWNMLCIILDHWHKIEIN